MSDQPVLGLALDDPPSLRPLTPDALAAVQRASLRVLAETGVAVGSPTARALLAAPVALACRERPSAPEHGPAGRGGARVARRTMTRPARPA